MGRIAIRAVQFKLASHMEAVGKLPDEPSVKEHNLLSVAYKNAVGSRRAAWRIIMDVHQKETTKGNEEQANLQLSIAKVRAEVQKIFVNCHLLNLTCCYYKWCHYKSAKL